MDDRQRQLLDANSFMHHNGIAVTQVTAQMAEARLTIAPESLNPYGLLHGGAYFTMADVASGALARSDGRSYVTVTSHINFVRSVRQGQVIARARLRHRGRSTCLIAVEVYDEEERLLATGEFTLFCIGEGGKPVP